MHVPKVTQHLQHNKQNKWNMQTSKLFTQNLASFMYLITKTIRVEQPMNNHLKTQGRSNPRVGLCCLWCPNKTSTPPI